MGGRKWRVQEGSITVWGGSGWSGIGRRKEVGGVDREKGRVGSGWSGKGGEGGSV